MTQIDEFESAFKSADKPRFYFEPSTLRRIDIVLDRSATELAGFVDHIKRFLEHLDTTESELEFNVIDGNDYDGIGSLLEVVKRTRPDLVCSYRNLHIPADEFPYSLGVYVDVLTQATTIPILLLPRPDMLSGIVEPELKKVMAVTDHLAGDASLVSYAARMCRPEGTLYLAHIEDEQTFERYIATIGKIPEIDTTVARTTIMDQLLKEPRDYIESCREGIRAAGLPLTIEEIVTVGHYMSDYRALVRDHDIDLLVVNTKDDDQLAMHGMAYPLSVEMRDIPMMML